MSKKAKSKKTSKTGDIYQLKITLRYTAPPIWRRVEVQGDTRLSKLHKILQIVMGWTDSHLHAFRCGKASYGTPDPDFPDDLQSERNVRLDQILAKGGTLIYEYDFGDGWEHVLEVEAIFEPASDATYPRCLIGQRACPPEDCGGPPGYQRLLEVLADSKDADYEEMREWLGSDFDAEDFNLHAVNRALAKLK